MNGIRLSRDNGQNVPLYDYTFDGLPSFGVTTLILTFLDFKEYSMKVIGLLSKRTRVFKVRHREELQEKLITWKVPSDHQVLDFG